MMRSTLALTALFAAVLTLALTAPARLVQADKPPANATTADVVPTETSSGVGVLHTMTLRKWRKGRILRVDVVLEVKELGGAALALLNHFSVNGEITVKVEYDNAHVCTGMDDCTVNASGWLDLDDAAAFDPGAFKGQPLVIEIFGRSEGSGSADLRRLRAVAQLIKK